MNEQKNMNRYSFAGLFLLYTSAFIIVVAGMRAAASLLIPFLLSMVIAIISAQPLFFLRQKRVPTILALLIVVIGVIGIGMVIAVIIGTSIDDFSRSVPLYQERLREKTILVLEWLDRLGIDVPKERLLEAFNPGAAMRMTASVLSGFGKVLTNAFFILLTVIFILLEASGFQDKLHVALADPGKSFNYLEKTIHNVQRYMAIKTWVSLATGIIIAVWLTILGVDYPLLWGMLAFLLNYVPSIGSIIAAVPAILLAVIQLGTGSALLTGLGYVVVNVVIGSVIEPRIMGRGLGLSTLVVFLSLVFWGWVFGPVGMLLSVPLTMAVKIALDSNEDTRWIAILLGSEASTEVSSETTSSPSS
jgi:predicted PurR-regulated permease PerM